MVFSYHLNTSNGITFHEYRPLGKNIDVHIDHTAESQNQVWSQNEVEICLKFHSAVYNNSIKRNTIRNTI